MQVIMTSLLSAADGGKNGAAHLSVSRGEWGRGQEEMIS